MAYNSCGWTRPFLFDICSCKGLAGLGEGQVAGMEKRLFAVRGVSIILAFFGVSAVLAWMSPADAGPAEIHYAPVENLEHIDVELLGSARAKIDLAAYSLTDWPVIDALVDAHRRGVAVRIVLDPSQQHALDRLREITADIRMKTPGPYMHLKSYSVDGHMLRSGSANLSASGLKQQDNDIVILREASAARAFEARFEQIWAEAKALPKPANLLARARRSSVADGDTAAPAGCLIKGNVSRKGDRIYHVPGDRTYNRVRMNAKRGERWFCTEEQAIAAGWRKAGGGKPSL